MTTVRQLLQSKGSRVWTAPPETSAYEALRIMAEHNVGAILVTRSDELLGVFSERDYARKVILQGKSSRETALSEIMSSPVASVGPDQTIQDCMTMMTEQRIRHLPVIEEGALVGLVSIGDVVKAVIAEQEFLIGQLEKYISGGR